MRVTRLYSRFTEKFRGLDLLAKEPSLQIGGQSSFKTMLGSSLTLLLACLLATATSFIVYDFFRTDQPQIAQEKQFSDSYPKVDMFAELHVPVLLIYVNDTVPVEAADVPKYFHARIVSYRYVVHNVNE